MEDEKVENLLEEFCKKKSEAKPEEQMEEYAFVKPLRLALLKAEHAY